MKVLLVGFKGKMGQSVLRIIDETDGMECVAGYDEYGLELFDSDSLSADVIIDFSEPKLTFEVLDRIAMPKKIPMVIGTKGFTKAQQQGLKTCSEVIPIFISFNMSYEIKLLCDVAKYLAPKLAGEFDIQILEARKNHTLKKPSDTALAIAAAANEDLDYSIIYNTQGWKNDDEIEISSWRGGNDIGEYTLCFLGEYDKLEIKHTAFSNEMFAKGAIRAARFLLDNKKGSGLYSMSDL